MAKLSQGILGGISGKIGNLVGSSWKGIPVIKTKPLSVANPQTAAQVAQRAKMSNIVRYGKPILSTVIKPLWDRNAQYQSGFNAFISANIANFASATGVVPADVVMSTGKMASTTIDSAIGTEAGGTVTVSWTDDSGTGYKLASDEAFVVVVSPFASQYTEVNVSATRADGVAVVNVPSDWEEADGCFAYLAFRRADGTVIGNSSFLGFSMGA